MGCAGRWGELERMAVIWVQIAKTLGRALGKTEPDVHLIKQVEQVTTSALGPTRLSQDPRARGVTDSVGIVVFLIWQLPHWLLFGCKNSQNFQKRPRATSGDAAGPNRRFHEPGHIGCRAVALPIPARLIYNRGNWLAAQISK